LKNPSTNPNPSAVNAAIGTQRFATLDVFRGMTIFLMIVVNTPGAGAEPFPPLLHAQWHGITLTDMVFPSFLFAVGNAMTFSMKKLEQRSNTYFLSKILKRVALIFLVGFLLNWYPFVTWNEAGEIALKPITSMRVMGVLQRIALAFGFAAILIRFMSTRKLLLISVLLLLIYWILLYVFGTAGAEYTVAGNAIRTLDLLLIGEKNMYREQGVAFDPEGLLSTLPSIVNVIGGYLAGKLIIQKGKTFETIAKMMMVGAGLILAAMLWHYFFPINKKLWSSSYVAYTVGVDMLALGILFYLIEMRAWKTGVYFFCVFGRNPLFIYVLAAVISIFFYLPVFGVHIFDSINNLIQAIIPGSPGSLMFAITYALICWFFGWVLDKRQIYIRL
jgi:predicted acyltransferase